MMPEVQENDKVWSMLSGARIIVSAESEVPLCAALERSKIAEETSDDDYGKALVLIEKVRQELDLNGAAETSNDQGRKILKHMLKDQPWGGSSKFDPLVGI